MNNKITYRREGDYFIPNLYIKDYKKLIKDKYIKELLSRIILDEKRHVEIFEMLLEKM